MCGRFTLHVPVPRVTEHFGLVSCPEFSLRYNIVPTRTACLPSPDCWRAWRSEAGDDLITTCIITTGPNGVMEPIHDRMPVILGRGDWDAWLGAENASTEALKGLLVPAPDDGMVAYPVSPAVNRASAEGEELILHA